jgi:hypothetical protein
MNLLKISYNRWVPTEIYLREFTGDLGSKEVSSCSTKCPFFTMPSTRIQHLCFFHPVVYIIFKVLQWLSTQQLTSKTATQPGYQIYI